MIYWVVVSENLLADITPALKFKCDDIALLESLRSTGGWGGGGIIPVFNYSGGVLRLFQLFVGLLLWKKKKLLSGKQKNEILKSIHVIEEINFLY